MLAASYQQQRGQHRCLEQGPAVAAVAGFGQQGDHRFLVAQHRPQICRHAHIAAVCNPGTARVSRAACCTSRQIYA